MPSPEEYRKKLRDLIYSEHKIGCTDFDCIFSKRNSRDRESDYQICETDDELRGSETPVCSNYGSPIKIVVLSLDAGSRAYSMEDQIAWLETDAYNDMEKENGWANWHGEGTKYILQKILREWDESEYERLFKDDYLSRFAHVRSAKCSIPGKLGADGAQQRQSSQAPPYFFDNCRNFVREEIAILEPDLIIAQGDYAQKTTEKFEQININLLNEYNIDNSNHRCNTIGYSAFKDKNILTIGTYHPAYYLARNKDYKEPTMEFINNAVKLAMFELKNR